MANSRIQNLRKVIRDPGDWPVFAVEGVRAMEEAIRAGVRVESVFYSSRLEATPRGVTLLDSLVSRGAEKVHVAENVMDKVAATEQSQGVVAVIRQMEWSLEDMIPTSQPVLLLDSLRDPGNMGTILRIADAFGLGGVIATPDSVQLYNQKVIRSAMGSIFRVPLAYLPIPEAVASLAEEDYRVIRAEVREGVPLAALRGKAERQAILLGNEAHGVHPENARLVPDCVHIPMPGAAESLNVAVSAGIIAYALTESVS